MKALLTYLLRLSCWVLGAVFVFSGFVKLIDPLGTAYKFQDYFTPLGLEHLTPYVIIFSVALSVIELLIGLNLITGIRLKLSLLMAAIFMAVMTPLTLWIALKNPVSDCGCFGDAWIIGNWTTFYKNIVLSLMVVTIALLMHYHVSKLKPKTEWILMGFSLFFLLAIAHINYYYLPMLDFRPYKIGNNLSQGMIIPPGAPTDVYASTFILEKNGVKKEFTLNNYPDTTWKFVDQHTQLIKKGYTPAIHDFSIHDSNMHDLTDSLLHLNNYLFLVVAYDLNQMQTNHLDDIENLYQYARQNHYAIYLLTGSTVNDAADFIQKTGLHIPVCTTDPTTLKTVIRSNPGLMLLYNGSVLNKWANASLPQFSKPLSNNPKDEMPKIPPMWKVVGLALLYILLFGGMRHWLKKGFKSKKRSNIFYHTTTNYSNK
jgi:uncharacterized membrane protein YphA (DoxX/SURF4 family)